MVSRVRRRAVALAVALLAASATGCRDMLQAFGGRGVSSKDRASELFGSLGARAIDPHRDAKYDSARVRIASAAVLPSRVYRDSSVWTTVSGVRRQLQVRGYFDGTRYRFESAPSVDHPDQPSESRHLIDLTRLSNDAYAWYTDVPYAVGAVTAEEVGRFFAALFASAEGRNESDVRADYRRMLPRASAVAGQLFRIDSIRTVPLSDRSTAAVFGITMTPQGIESRYPQYAKYLRKYVQSARTRWTVTDATGAVYFECVVASGHLLMRVRTQGGRMIALYGPTRSMPDSLTLNGEVSVRIRGFTVGFRDYHADFRIVADDHERSWDIVSRREPEWVLPLITERLLRTPLRRPFQGDGAHFRIGVRDSAGAQTVVFRRARLEVQESAILRFIGRLGAIAIGDYAGEVEKEEMAWLNDLFTALLADLR